MKLIYQKDHISIKKFDPIEINDFTVLTGLNGSGKTHLLQAIENRSVVIEGHENENIVYFDYKNFFLDNESAYLGYAIHNEKEGAWSFFEQEVKNKINPHKNNIGNFYEKITEITNSKDKSIWELNDNDIEDNDIKDSLNTYRNSIDNLFKADDRLKDNQNAKAIFILLKELKYSIDEIDKNTFLDRYKPYLFKGNFLPTQLGKVISDYYYKLDNNSYKKFKKESKNAKVNYLPDKEFVNIHGEKPWILMSEILEKFKNFDFEIIDPETLELERDQHYKFKLINSNSGVEVDLENLSSGEKVLMALIAAVYKSSSDRDFPKVLLLDEIDASLHPSMIENLLNVIKKNFVENDVKVIFATHSPTTVARVEEDSLFEIRAGNKQEKIKRISKSDAVDILSDGFMTLEKGLKIFDEIFKKDLTIISEGKNQKHIKKALEILDEYLIEKIQFYEHDSGSGEADLLGLFEFIKKTDIQKPVLFIWDCDSIGMVGKKTDSKRVLKFCFDKNNNNKICTKGIENLYPEDLFTDDLLKIGSVTENRKTIEIKEFTDSSKNKFFKKIKKETRADIFTNFNHLVIKIKEILSPAN